MACCLWLLLLLLLPRGQVGRSLTPFVCLWLLLLLLPPRRLEAGQVA